MDKKTKNSSNNLVSIGVPVYNGETFLAEALESIQKQTYENWECNIVNNASTDRTPEIAREFVKKDSRFKLHNYDDFVQIVINWNRTLLHISPEAEYYKIVQADDLIDPLHLEEMVRVMDKHPTTGMCSSYRIDGKDVNCDGLDIFEGEFYKGKEMLIRHLNREIDITGSMTTLLFRIKYLKQLPGYPAVLDEDDFHCDHQLAFDVMNISDVGFAFKILSYTRWHEEAYTSRFCVKYNTFINSQEINLYKFRNLDPKFEKDYKRTRFKYAYFLLIKKLRGDKKAVEWHNKFLKRKITFKEYLSSLLLLNIFSRQIDKVLKKLGLGKK